MRYAMNKFLIFLFTALLLITFSANTQISSLTKNKTLSSTAGNLELDVPANWHVLDLHDDPDIEIGNELEETYLIVLSDAKEDLYGWNLTKHSRLTLGNFLTSIDFPEIVGPISLEVNGNPAVQFEIHGSAQGLSISYIHTTIETSGYFNQILSWTLQSRFEEKRPVFDKLMSCINNPVREAEMR